MDRLRKESRQGPNAESLGGNETQGDVNILGCIVYVQHYYIVPLVDL